MDKAQFLRLFEIRGPQIMWFLGAGASSAAGIPTAADMIWDFKRRLFCSEQGVPRVAVSDIGNEIVRDRIQTYLDETQRFPPAGDEQEYCDYFETTFPSADDRQKYVYSLMEDCSPSYGHTALAALMKAGKVQVVWTTNFDKLVEDAAARVFGTVSKVVVADLGEPQKATQTLQRGSSPLVIKLHGDFHSVRLKNTNAELRKADDEMRSCLVDACKRSGLAVVGYSGRDASVMEALEEAVTEGAGFPAGLFWFKRSEDNLFKRVATLIGRASSGGIQAHIIELETFDELLDSIVRFLPGLPEETMQLVKTSAPILSPAPLRESSLMPPVLRMNALPVLGTPTICRLVKCNIGGQEEVNAALDKAQKPILARRSSAGVLAFGGDNDIRKTFEDHEITEFDTYPMQPERLRHQTGEKRLVFDALVAGLRRQTNLRFERRGSRVYVLADEGIPNVAIFNEKKAGTLANLLGIVDDIGIKWVEACQLNLDYRFGRLWILLGPTVLLCDEVEASQALWDIAKEFVRQRTAIRYNQESNSILTGWIKAIFGDDRGDLKLTALGITDGIDAIFEISRITGFSGMTR